MSFMDKINTHWNNGIKGTEEVPLEEGINYVSKIAEEAMKENIVTTQDKRIEDTIK